MVLRFSDFRLALALVLLLFAAPLAAEAQQAGKVPRLGILSPGTVPRYDDALRQGLRDLGYIEGRNIFVEHRATKGDMSRAPQLAAEHVDAYRGGLRELGYKEGQNIDIIDRSSDGRDERFPHLVSELVRLNVDLILTRGTPAALAAKNASRTIPIAPRQRLPLAQLAEGVLVDLNQHDLRRPHLIAQEEEGVDGARLPPRERADT